MSRWSAFFIDASCLYDYKKRTCVSIGDVKLWNGMILELKQCPSMIQLKKKKMEMIFKSYRDEGELNKLQICCEI